MQVLLKAFCAFICSVAMPAIILARMFRFVDERVCVNRTEALNILGLDDDASAADIKSAYRECVQILHPDRFANNKKPARSSD